jgi:hypothetical protein
MLGREADHLMPRSRIVELYFHYPIRLHGMVHRDNFTLVIIIMLLVYMYVCMHVCM